MGVFFMKYPVHPHAVTVILYIIHKYIVHNLVCHYIHRPKPDCIERRICFTAISNDIPLNDTQDNIALLLVSK